MTEVPTHFAIIVGYESRWITEKELKEKQREKKLVWAMPIVGEGMIWGERNFSTRFRRRLRKVQYRINNKL